MALAATYEQFKEAVEQLFDSNNPAGPRLWSPGRMRAAVRRALKTNSPYASKLVKQALEAGDLVRVSVSESGQVYGLVQGSVGGLLYLHLDNKFASTGDGEEYAGSVRTDYPEGALWSGGSRYMLTTRQGYQHLLRLRERAQADEKAKYADRQAKDKQEQADFLARYGPEASNLPERLAGLGIKADFHFMEFGGEVEALNAMLKPRSPEAVAALLDLLIAGVSAKEEKS